MIVTKRIRSAGPGAPTSASDSQWDWKLSCGAPPPSWVRKDQTVCWQLLWKDSVALHRLTSNVKRLLILMMLFSGFDSSRTSAKAWLTWGEGCGLDSERGPRSGYCVVGALLPPSGVDARASGPPRHSLLHGHKDIVRRTETQQQSSFLGQVQVFLERERESRCPAG